MGRQCGLLMVAKRAATQNAINAVSDITTQPTTSFTKRTNVGKYHIFKPDVYP